MFFDFFISSGLITVHKFVKINTITPNYVHNNIFQLIHQYKYPTILNLHKTELGCIENCHWNKLFEFFIIFGHIAKHKFVKINTNTHNYIYNRIFLLIHQFIYFITPIFRKMHWRQLFKQGFWVFHHFWPHNHT
jgi:hypothetical protein